MRKKFAERSPALNALYLKRAAFLVALFLSVLLGACNGQSDRNPRFEKDYVSAYDLTHRFNLAVYPDLVTGAFHFTGQAAISVLVDSTRCSINGSEHTFSRPVKLVDGDLMLPREIITLLEREVDEEVFSYVEKTFTYTPPTFSATPRTILPKTPEPTPRPKWVVVLDPGHGGSDPGAIGPDTRVTEARLNLDIARLVADKLRARGCTVYLTRSSDIYLSLGHRVRFANNRDADVFVSIHHNASRDRSVRGFEVFYSKNNPNGASRLKRSVELGKSICNSLHGRWNTRNRGCKHKSLYVTRLTSMASVLVEVEFMTCRDIEKQMTGDWFQGQAAAGISIGIMNHLRN